MREPLRLGILVTHPIQYYTALFRELARTPGVDLTVYFAHRPTPAQQGGDFGVAFEWDMDLTSGYRHVWLDNRAMHPGVESFAGCDTPAITDAIRHRGFHAFLLMGWHSRSYWQAMRACWALGVPTLVRGDSQLEDDAPAKRAAKRAIYPLFLRRFSACLSVGTRSEEYFRYYGARSVVRSPHFVDNAFFARGANSVNRDEVRSRFGLEAGGLVVCFAGKLIQKKRPLDLIEAVARLDRDDVHVLVVGDGELRDSCEASAKASGVRARFTGFLNQSQIPGAYGAADVLVLPSGRGETWGLTVNEAMATGLPAIVSTSVGCGPDLVVDGQTGFRFATGDIGTLSAHLNTLASESRLREYMGDQARRRVSGFSVEAAAAGVLDAAARAREALAA